MTSPLAAARDLRTTNSSIVPTADAVRRNALEGLILSQVALYGTSVWDPIQPPPPGAAPDQVALFEDMCRAHAEIQQLGTE